jgi:hypothetical protein
MNNQEFVQYLTAQTNAVKSLNEQTKTVTDQYISENRQFVENQPVVLSGALEDGTVWTEKAFIKEITVNDVTGDIVYHFSKAKKDGTQHPFQTVKLPEGLKTFGITNQAAV